MNTGGLQLVCFILLGQLHLGITERKEVYVRITDMSESKQREFTNGRVTFSHLLKSDHLFNGTVQLKLPCEPSQSQGSESRKETKTKSSVFSWGPGKNSKSRVDEGMTYSALKDPKLLAKDVEKHYFFLKKKSITYIKALPGVMDEVNDLYVVSENTIWAYVHNGGGFITATLTFTNFPLPFMNNILIANEMNPIPSQGILELPSLTTPRFRLYCYLGSRDDLNLLEKVLSSDYTKGILAPHAQLFGTKVVNEKIEHFDIRFESWSCPISPELHFGMHVVVVEITAGKSRYNPGLEFYSVLVNGQELVAFRDHLHQSPFELVTAVHLQRSKPIEAELQVDTFYKQETITMYGPFEHRWTCLNEIKDWKVYNCKTEIFERLEAPYGKIYTFKKKKPVPSPKTLLSRTLDTTISIGKGSPTVQKSGKKSKKEPRDTEDHDVRHARTT